MYALIGWIVYAAPDSWEAWSGVKSYLVFYVVIVLSLNTITRLKRFLVWWTVLILVLAAVAVASEFGIDPLGNKDWTNQNDGRLCVDLSIFRNPNALGHNVVPAVMMSYFAFMWARPIFMQQLGVFILLLPLYCIYLTVSKGAFLSLFLTSVTSFVFKRHFVLQILFLFVAVTIGWGALFALPRMGALQRNPKSDPGIAQRILLWTRGYRIYQTVPEGVGYMQWWASMYRDLGWIKAPHSTYVQVGAELGKKGFFLYLAVLYCCLRTLVTARTANTEEERVRRMLFVLLIAYSASSWMIDFGYRPTYFMFAGACAAFHRVLYFRSKKEEEAAAAVEAPLPRFQAVPAGGPALPMPAVAAVMAGATAVGTMRANVAGKVAEPEAEPLARGVKWNRIGIIDVVMVYIMVRVAERFWVYAIGNMF
jgi:O-antigen ligase